jgi:hypothetical protein
MDRYVADVGEGDEASRLSDRPLIRRIAPVPPASNNHFQERLVLHLTEWPYFSALVSFNILQLSHVSKRYSQGLFIVFPAFHIRCRWLTATSPFGSLARQLSFVDPLVQATPGLSAESSGEHLNIYHSHLFHPARPTTITSAL